MKPSWTAISDVFDAAVALPAEGRSQFLAERCGADPELLREVESLLECDAAVGADYLEPPAPAATTDAREPEPGAVVGGCRLVRRIGQGGMGVVFEAQQVEPQRRVAVKILTSLSNVSGARRRFAREVHLLARMNHPAIARVFASGVDAGIPYLAMEFVEGALPITEYARRHALSEHDAIRLFRRVCDGVAHGHAKGVVHRDLKPANVLIDDQGAPKLIDFGVARVLDIAEGDEHWKTRAGEFAGTVQYMSPEQADAGATDVKAETDVYALGLVLYEVLCGRPARSVVGKGLTEALKSVVDNQVPPARKVRADLPQELEWVLGRALEHDPARRYSSVVEFDRDLGRYLSHEPVLAGPRSRAYEARLWMRRHPTVTAVLGVVLVSIVALTVLAVRTVARGRDLERLSDAQRLRDLERRADLLWPAEPRHVAAMTAWLAEARALSSNLAVHRATLAELRSRALPRTAEEIAEDAAGHPRAAELATAKLELALARSAIARRSDAEAEPSPAANFGAYAGIQYGYVLNNSAFALIDPDQKGLRRPDVALGLALHALKLELCDHPATLDTVAWAYFRLGDDESAAEFSDRSLEEARKEAELAESSASSVSETDHEPSDAARKLADLEGSAARLFAAIDHEHSTAGRHEAATRVIELEARVQALETAVARPRQWQFTDASDAWWHEALSDLVDRLEEFLDPERGLLGGKSLAHGLGVEPRLEFARDVERRTLVEPADAWRAAITAVAANPRYGGLVLTPQLGLVPLGADRDSGLLEFADLASGEPPERDTDGRLRMLEDSAVVFVLIPGGTFRLGAQRTDPDGVQYDPLARDSEGPPRSMSLDPFFMSKYELDIAQWLRATGTRPNTYAEGDSAHGELITALHPIETVSWTQCTKVLARQDWCFPTDTQWEYAARAGTTTPWWTGSTPESLQGAANISDRHVEEVEPLHERLFENALDDGRFLHAPIGSYLANGFGLHDVHGNVSEWCADLLAGTNSARREGDGLVLDSIDDRYVLRGGGFDNNDAERARSSKRIAALPNFSNFDIGVRPARRLQP